MSEVNGKLRAARVARESPSSPGESMTRQELAEAVNEHVYRASGGGQVTAVTANHVGKWERATVGWPSARYRAALRAILDVATDRELGFVRPRRGKPVDDVDRKTFLHAALGTAAGAIVGGRSRRVGEEPDLVAAVSAPTGHYRRLEQGVPSDQLAPVVEAHLTLATGLVRDRLRGSTGFAVLAEIAGLAAWLAADRGDNPLARRRYLDAVGHAERAHHPLLAAYMTASLGQFAVDSGDPRPGLVLLDRAEAQLDASSPSAARAWLASLRAVAHATLGDATATRIALRIAEVSADRPVGEPVWPWVFTFDQAKAARYRGTALARIGDLRAATSAFDAASAALVAPKPRALAEVERAAVVARGGSVGAGCVLALRALRVGHEYGSERVLARVRAFRAGLPVRSREVAALDEALRELYGTRSR